ncbi:hypothetical protein [Nitrosomonas sp.]|uniref:hypothetical protein n=1 Tax=Nitrosomonas sp. TaxID=42353 RepID=UPI00374D186F
MGSQHLYPEPGCRLLDKEVSGHFFAGVKQLAEWVELSGDEHFSIDGTLLEACALHKSLIRKNGGSNPPVDHTRNPSRDFAGEKHSNATHESATDSDARRCARVTAMPVFCATWGMY